MGNGVQLEHGYVRIANRLMTALARAPWDSGAQLRMVMALMRMTYGVQRKAAPIGMSDWRTLTGLSDRQITHVKGVLHRNGVLILVQEANPRKATPQVWQLEKDCGKWKRFRVDQRALLESETLVGHTLMSLPPTTTAGGEVSGGAQGLRGATGAAGDPPTTTAGDPPPERSGGNGSKPYSPNGSRPPKDSKDSKDREDTPLTHTSSLLQVAGGREDGDGDGLGRWSSLARENICYIHGGTERDVQILGQRVGVGIEMNRFKAMVQEQGRDPELVARAIRFLPEVTNLQPPVSLARWGDEDDGWAIFQQCEGLAMREAERSGPRLGLVAEMAGRMAG